MAAQVPSGVAASRSHLLRGGAGSFALRAVNALIAFSLTVLLARSLGPAGYGIYAYAVALVVLLNIPTEGGLPMLVVRETAAARVRGQWGLLRGVWHWAGWAAAGLGLLVATAGLLAAWLVRDHFSPVALTSFMLALLLVPLIVLANLCGAALRGLHHVIVGQLPEYIIRPALLLGCVAGFLWWQPTEIRADIAVALHTLAAATALGASLLLLRGMRPAMPPAPLQFASKAWLSSTLPLTLVAAMHVIHQNTDIVMLGLFRSSEEVGLYRVVAQAALTIGFGLTAMNLVAAPHFARLYANGDLAGLQRSATLSARLVLAMTVPIVVLFLLLAEPIIVFIFGEAYRGGGTALVILAVGQLGNAFFGAVGFLLNMTGHERDTARGMAVAAAANVVLNLALIPPFGINGAAAATAMTMVLWNVLLWRAVHRRLGIDSTALALKVRTP